MTRLGLRAGLLALVLEGLFSRLSFGLISFALPLYARHLGFSLSEIGLLVALNSTISVALKPMMGALADRFGRKQTLLAGIGLRSAVSGLLAVAYLPWHLFAIRGVHGLSMSLRDPSVAALIAEEGGKNQVASAFAWYQTAKTTAAQLSKGLAGFLLTLTAANFALVFSIAFALSILPGLVVALFVKADHERPVPGIAGPRLTTLGLREPAGPSQPAFQCPRVLPYMVVGFLTRATADMLDGLLPIIATEYAGLSEAETGLVYMVACGVLIISGPVFGRLVDRVNSDIVLGVRGGANALSSLIYLWAPWFGGILAGKTLDDLGKAAYRPAWGNLMAEVSSADRRARSRIMSILMMGEDLGAILAPILAGFLWSTWGIGVALGTRCALAIVTELCTIAVAAERVNARDHRRTLQTGPAENG